MWRATPCYNNHTLSSPERIFPFSTWSLARILATPLCLHNSISPLYSKSCGQFCKQKNGKCLFTLTKKRVQDLDTYINQPTLSLQLYRQLQVCCEWSVIRSTFDNHELWTTHLQINLTPVLHPSLFPYQMLGQFIIPYSFSAAHQHDERLHDMFHSAQSWLSHQSHWYPSQARTCNIICKVNHSKHKH